MFFVGDEFQSIYGFRHADVEVFRERRAAAAQRLPLTRELPLAARGARGGQLPLRPAFGDGFQPLAASGEFPDPVFGHPVELLVTDKASYRGSGEHWRRAEARHVARRVRELVDDGRRDARARSCSCSRPARTPSGTRRSCARSGLPTYRATGRRYFGQQQVVDLLLYLRLLRNRYDDEALVAVLASPFVGVSNDALVLIRRHAGRRPLFTGIERSLPDGARRATTSGSCARSSSATSGSSRRRRASRSSGSASRSSREHDYDLAVLARWDGQRRYANLRKLMRLARSYEELRGRDIEGFVRFIREQEALGAAQLEAVSEEEGADAVRLLTIHAREGARVQGRRRRGRGPRHGRAAAGRRDPRALGRPLRLQGRAPGDRASRTGVFGYERGARGRASRPTAASGCASTTSR